MTSILLTVAVLLVSSPPMAQGVLASAAPQDARPTAIAGMASSARHCVSGDAANVHGLGWVAAGTSYTITFESDFPLSAAISRLDLANPGSVGTIGTPDFRTTASTPGTMALYVGATGQGGCYRYKVEMTPPAGVAASPLSSPAASPSAGKLAKSSGPMAIASGASSALYCVAGAYVSNVHDIGWVEEGKEITITFESDFDPIAGITMRNMITQRGTYLVDDDGGGNLEPQFSFMASQSSTLALYVAGFDGSSGCYRYKVEIR